MCWITIQIKLVYLWEAWDKGDETLLTEWIKETQEIL